MITLTPKPDTDNIKKKTCIQANTPDEHRGKSLQQYINKSNLMMYKINYMPQLSEINTSYARLVKHLKISHCNLPCKWSNR